MLKVAITGATGFVGQALYDLLTEIPGIHITTLGRRNPHKTSGFINIDTESPTNIAEQLHNYDCMIHLAARAHTHNSTKEDFDRDNIHLTKKLAKIAVDAHITQFIYLSSIKVLGNKTAPEKPFDIDDSPMPEDDYGKSKLECENLLISSLSHSKTSYSIIRPPLVWGAKMKGNLKIIVDLINKGVPLPFASIKNRRDIISLMNLIDFIKHILVNKDAFNEIFLVSDGEPLSTCEIVHLMENFSIKKAKLFLCPQIIFTIGTAFPKLRKKIESFSGNLEVDISYTMKKLNWTPRK